MVIKIMDLIGSSTKSWPDAVEEAVSKAGQSIRNINEAEIVSLRAKIENGKITQYLASIKIGFSVE
ncbi:MAG: dodecin family protein [Candidatus Nitrosotenuis sp.]